MSIDASVLMTDDHTPLQIEKKESCYAKYQLEKCEEHVAKDYTCETTTEKRRTAMTLLIFAGCINALWNYSLLRTSRSASEPVTASLTLAGMQ